MLDSTAWTFPVEVTTACFLQMDRELSSKESECSPFNFPFCASRFENDHFQMEI